MFGLIYAALVIPPFIWVMVTAARYVHRHRQEGGSAFDVIGNRYPD